MVKSIDTTWSALVCQVQVYSNVPLLLPHRCCNWSWVYWHARPPPPTSRVSSNSCVASMENEKNVFGCRHKIVYRNHSLWRCTLWQMWSPAISKIQVWMIDLQFTLKSPSTNSLLKTVLSTKICQSEVDEKTLLLMQFSLESPGFNPK